MRAISRFGTAVVVADERARPRRDYLKLARSATAAAADLRWAFADRVSLRLLRPRTQQRVVVGSLALVGFGLAVFTAFLLIPGTQLRTLPIVDRIEQALSEQIGIVPQEAHPPRAAIADAGEDAPSGPAASKKARAGSSSPATALPEAASGGVSAGIHGGSHVSNAVGAPPENGGSLAPSSPLPGWSGSPGGSADSGGWWTAPVLPPAPFEGAVASGQGNSGAHGGVGPGEAPSWAPETSPPPNDTMSEPETSANGKGTGNAHGHGQGQGQSQAHGHGQGHGQGHGHGQAQGHGQGQGHGHGAGGQGADDPVVEPAPPAPTGTNDSLQLANAAKKAAKEAANQAKQAAKLAAQQAKQAAKEAAAKAQQAAALAAAQAQQAIAEATEDGPSGG